MKARWIGLANKGHIKSALIQYCWNWSAKINTWENFHFLRIFSSSHPAVVALKHCCSDDWSWTRLGRRGRTLWKPQRRKRTCKSSAHEDPECESQWVSWSLVSCCQEWYRECQRGIWSGQQGSHKCQPWQRLRSQLPDRKWPKEWPGTTPKPTCKKH